METPFGPFTGTSFNVAAFAYSSRYLSNLESIFVFKPFIVKYGAAEAAAAFDGDARDSDTRAPAPPPPPPPPGSMTRRAAAAAAAAAAVAFGSWIIGTDGEGGRGRDDSGSGGPGRGGIGGNGGGGSSIDAIILLYYLGDIISILPSLYTSYKNVCYVRTLGVPPAFIYSFLAMLDIRRRRLKCVILKELMILHQL